MSAKPLGSVRRLADSAVFQALLRKGRRMNAGPIAARVLDATQPGAGGRIGLSIAKRHLKKATQRNAIKRMAREAYRLRGDALKGMDVLVMLSEGPKSSDELRQIPAALRSRLGRKRLRASMESVLDLLVSGNSARQAAKQPREGQ